jgi:phenylacetate-CoA ligase
MPVRIRSTQLVSLLWSVFTLRDHLWHRRDLRRKLATIRHSLEPGARDNWGPATAGIFRTGPVVFQNMDVDAGALLDWLCGEKPDYLLTYPTLAAELASLSLSKGKDLRLTEVRAFSEMLRPGVRELCREAWGAKLIDLYSAVELGNIALQCPESEHYHVQSEDVIVEVLDDSGVPCAPGTIGRVVITSLHNFAMPLVRYEIGDFAEAGAPCSCGRGLPVLSRIAGRLRGMLTAPDGKRYWPYFGSRGMLDIAPIRQIQVVQKSFRLLEVRLVVGDPLSADQEERLRRHLLSHLPRGLELAFSYRDSIERTPGGKFEDFYSEVERQ